ncbi:MAG: alkaline phosphatase family protein [Leptothrix sp. (in: b-proteobacteria)]
MGALPRVVVFIQENKTTDFYFPTLAKWGAKIKPGGTLLAAAPAHDQPHDRSAWVHYRMGDYPALAAQIDNDAVIPYYSWLAKTFTFCDHHFGLGTNSTPGHMLAVGGQTPTLKNPPFGAAGPQWDLPSIFLHAERAGLGWAAFTDSPHYPIKFYTELNTPAAHKNIHSAANFVTLAKAGKLPQLVYAWGPSGADEHPPSQAGDTQYVARGQQAIWDRVNAVVQGGHWHDTIFILTWDDWGGYADHVVTPDLENVPDALHPQGFPIIGGARIPLIMFGGAVRQGIDNTWHSHASIPKTIIDLLQLPAFGVPRVDQAPSLAGFVSRAAKRPSPPAPGTAIVQPTPPTPTPVPIEPPPWRGPLSQPMPALIANHGQTIPAPTDALVHPAPPKAPLA